MGAAQKAPAQRWISVEDAASRMPMRRQHARRLLSQRGLVQTLTYTDDDGQHHTVRAVWLPALETLSDEMAAQMKKAAQLAQAPRDPAVVQMPRPSSMPAPKKRRS